MATASADPDTTIKLMEDHLSCSICYNLLREPKDLDCPHMFCLHCLQEWVKGDQVVKCPECRYITVVPEGGLVDLKTNLRLKNMVEEYSKGIKKQKASAPICPNHEGEKQHFFCVTCGVTVCHNCLVLEHRMPEHEIKELKEISKTRKAEMMRKVNHVNDKIATKVTEIKALEDAEKKIEAAKDKTVKDIKEQLQHIVSSAEAKGKELIACAEIACQERKKLLFDKREEVQNTITRIQNIQTKTRNVVDTAADHVYMKQHVSLVNEMDKLCMTEHESDESQDVGSLCFNPGTDPMNLLWFGDVIISGNKICGLKLVKEFGPFPQAAGVAVSPTGLTALVDQDTKEAIIFCDVDGEYKRQFCLGSPVEVNPSWKITEPYDVAVTSDGRFLVTHDAYTAAVFSPPGRYEKTLTEVGDRITTTPDGMIVTGSSATGVITVHQSGGKLIRKHQVYCKRMVGIDSNGKQIAYTSVDLEDLTDGKVCAIDFVTGQLIWTVDMIAPFALCYEPTSSTLLVAGGLLHLGKNIIDQCSSTTGCLISRLASDLLNPLSMPVTHDNKLIVADDKTVKVYHMH